MADRMRMSGPKGQPRKGRPRKSRPRTTKNKVRKLQTQVRKISKTLKQNVEVKNNDSSFPNTAIDWNGLITTPIFAPTVGDTRATRTGAQVTVTGGQIKYRVSSSTLSAGSIRVLLVLDKEGAGTALTDYFNTVGVFGTPTAPLAFFDRDRRAQFKVLYDKLHEFDYATGNLQQYDKIKIPKFQVQFDDASTTIRKNALRVILVSDITVAGNRPAFESEARIYFTDM